MSKEQFDKLVSKWISRKLLVFLFATLFLATGHITNTQWMSISMLYIGVETYLNKA